ncbi:MAG TPA: DUF5989 family protein [Candidatus Paceibacterota bacterium]
MDKLKILKEFYDFIKARKKWWLAPIIIFLILLGSMVFLTQGSVIAPFVYTFF